MLILANAFSVNMLTEPKTLQFVQVNENIIAQTLQSQSFQSIIGHNSTAEFLSKRLCVQIDCNRQEYKLKSNDVLIVVTLGKRLEEGKVLTQEELIQFPVQYWVVKEV
jgi:hypothetical protein